MDGSIGRRRKRPNGQKPIVVCSISRNLELLAPELQIICFHRFTEFRIIVRTKAPKRYLHTIEAKADRSPGR